MATVCTQTATDRFFHGCVFALCCLYWLFEFALALLCPLLTSRARSLCRDSTSTLRCCWCFSLAGALHIFISHIAMHGRYCTTDDENNNGTRWDILLIVLRLSKPYGLWDRGAGTGAGAGVRYPRMRYGNSFICQNWWNYCFQFWVTVIGRAAAHDSSTPSAQSKFLSHDNSRNEQHWYTKVDSKTLKSASQDTHRRFFGAARPNQFRIRLCALHAALDCLLMLMEPYPDLFTMLLYYGVHYCKLCLLSKRLCGKCNAFTRMNGQMSHKTDSWEDGS